MNYHDQIKKITKTFSLRTELSPLKYLQEGGMNLLEVHDVNVTLQRGYSESQS